MPFKFYQNISFLNSLQEKAFHLQLGEILHFILGTLCVKRNFEPSSEELNLLIEKALFLYTHPFQAREDLKTEALKILFEVFSIPRWGEFAKILKDCTAIFREIEVFSGPENQLLRPDLLAFKEREVLLWEFKLRRKDFKEEQIIFYKSFLDKLYPNKKKRFYLLTFVPFDFEMIVESGGFDFKYDTKEFSHPTQLTLFKNPG